MRFTVIWSLFMVAFATMPLCWEGVKMACGKLPASERFFDSGCRFRRLKKEPKGIHFSISVRMPSDDDPKRG